MRWRKRDLLRAAIVVGGVLFLVLMALVIVSVADARGGVSGSAALVAATVQPTPTEDATVTTLNKEKLQHENDWLWNYGATILTSLISTLTLAAAGIFTVMRYFNDRQYAREKQEAEAKHIVEDRQAERERRDDDRLQNTIAGLGSERIEARAVAASMLLTFLEQPGYERFHQQIFNLAVTNLRLRHVDPNTPEPPDSLSQALVTVFKESFPLAREMLKKRDGQFNPQLLDASHIQLDNALLAPKVDLEGIFMRGALLRCAYLFGVNLSGANLRWADLGRADLRDAVLNRADLGNANLSGADLSGVRNLEEARSLDHTDLRGTKGLTKEQLEACKAKGAIIDEEPTASLPHSTVPPSPPPQQSS